MTAQAQIADFHTFVATAQQRLGIDDAETARRCKTSVPAVDRWKRGVSVPHPASIASIQAALS